MNLAPGPRATLSLINLIRPLGDKDPLHKLVDSLDRHKKWEVVKERRARWVTGRCEMDILRLDAGQGLFGIEGLVLFALEATGVGIGVGITGEVVSTGIGIVGPERELLVAVHRSILDGVLRKEGDQRIQILVVDAGFPTQVVLDVKRISIGRLQKRKHAKRTLTETEKAWIKLIMELFSMMTLSFASLGLGSADFEGRSVATWIQMMLAKFRLYGFCELKCFRVGSGETYAQGNGGPELATWLRLLESARQHR